MMRARLKDAIWRRSTALPLGGDGVGVGVGDGDVVDGDGAAAAVDLISEGHEAKMSVGLCRSGLHPII